jgi:hypothetical protein
MMARSIMPIAEQQPDANVSVILGVAGTGMPVAVTSIDFNADGPAELLLVMTMLPVNQPLGSAALNNFNSETASKIFYKDGQAGMALPIMAAGPVSDDTVGFGFDLFGAETETFLAAIGPFTGSAVNVSLGKADPKRLDAGLSRAEISARDNAYTAKLNGGHMGSSAAGEGGDHQALFDEAAAAARRIMGQR